MSDGADAAVDAAKKAPSLAAQVGPFAIVGAGVAWLVRHYGELPARMPVHWNRRGEVDSFIARTPVTAALPLLLGLGVILSLLAMQIGLRRSAPAAPTRAATLRVMLAAEYLIAFVSCGIVAASASSGRLLWPFLGAAFAGVLVVLALAIRATRAIPKAPARNPEAWRAGFLYVDPDDPALLVPKRSGSGYTLNVGRPLAVVLAVALVVLPLAVGLLALSAR